MTSFFAQFKLYGLLALLAALGIVAFMLLATKNDLQDANNQLSTAKTQITTLNETAANLIKDLRSKESINVILKMSLSTIDEIHKEDLNDLTTQLEKIAATRSTAIITVNKVGYIDESYVKKATDAVLESMWKTYCKQNGTCT
jgi:type III secretory pathway component EscV